MGINSRVIFLHLRGTKSPIRKNLVKVIAAIAVLLAPLMDQNLALAHPVDDSGEETIDTTSGLLSDQLERERRSVSNP